MIQVQADRFIHNWRKTESADEYPRYEHIRDTFSTHLNAFSAFTQREGLGELRPNQTEVTYVNLVRGASRLDQVVGIAGASYAGAFLPSAEDARAATRYVIEHKGSAVGRLLIDARTLSGGEDPMIVINLTARGQPLEPTIGGVLAFMDLGRQWVVRGFADVTTPEMHREWERRA